MKFVREALVLLFTLSAGCVWAADLPEMPVAADPSFTWTGFYLGGHAGWGFEDQEYPAACVCGPGSNVEMDLNGFLGGVQIGWNYQFDNSFVAGLEADYTWTDMSGSGSSVLPSPDAGGIASITSSLDELGTIRARLGFAVDRLLFYGTGGAAYGRTHLEFRVPYTIDDLRDSYDDTRWGWVAGAGVEWAFHDDWSLKAEYLHFDLGGGGDEFGATGGFGFISRTQDYTPDVIRLGVNYRF